MTERDDLVRRIDDSRVEETMRTPGSIPTCALPVLLASGLVAACHGKGQPADPGAGRSPNKLETPTAARSSGRGQAAVAATAAAGGAVPAPVAASGVDLGVAVPALSADGRRFVAEILDLERKVAVVDVASGRTVEALPIANDRGALVADQIAAAKVHLGRSAWTATRELPAACRGVASISLPCVPGSDPHLDLYRVETRMLDGILAWDHRALTVTWSPTDGGPRRVKSVASWLWHGIECAPEVRGLRVFAADDQPTLLVETSLPGCGFPAVRVHALSLAAPPAIAPVGRPITVAPGFASEDDLPAISTDGALVAAMIDDENDDSGRAPPRSLVVWRIADGRRIAEVGSMPAGWSSGEHDDPARARADEIAARRQADLATRALAGRRWVEVTDKAAPRWIESTQDWVIQFDDGRILFGDDPGALTTRQGFPPVGHRGCGNYLGVVVLAGGRVGDDWVLLAPDVIRLGGDECVGLPSAGLATLFRVSPPKTTRPAPR